MQICCATRLQAGLQGGVARWSTPTIVASFQPVIAHYTSTSYCMLMHGHGDLSTMRLHVSATDLCCKIPWLQQTFLKDLHRCRQSYIDGSIPPWHGLISPSYIRPSALE